MLIYLCVVTVVIVSSLIFAASRLYDLETKLSNIDKDQSERIHRLTYAVQYVIDNMPSRAKVEKEPIVDDSMIDPLARIYATNIDIGNKFEVETTDGEYVKKGNVLHLKYNLKED